MTTIIKTNIVKIGNSQGVRIPKILLDQTLLEDEVELEVEEGKIIIRPAGKVREGWAEQFKQLAKQNDAIELDDIKDHSWDNEEWEW